MKRVVLSLLLLSMAVLTGCATQGPVALDKSYWVNKPESVGVIIAKTPNVGSHKRGAQGLLDMAINNAMASGIDKHLNSLKLDEFREAGQVIASHFSGQGVPTKFIEEEIDLSTVSKVKKAPKGTTSLDFAALKSKYGVDHLVVLEVLAAGTIRSYYGFIPLTAPQGYFMCKGTLVNLQDNKILWLGTGTKEVIVDEPWDQEATAYPHVTSAFYQALEGAKTDLLRTLVSADGRQASAAK
jgi:hypothetical protein